MPSFGGEDYELCFTVLESEPWRAGCRAGHLGVPLYLYRANDGGYRRESPLCVTENLSLLTGKDMTILPRHKDVAKCRLNLRNCSICSLPALAAACSRGAGARWVKLAAIPFWYSDDVSAVAAALFAGRDVWDSYWRLSLPSDGER